MAIGVRAAYIASARPETSSTVSPFALRPIAKPATWASVAWPARISPIAHVVCSTVRSERATRAARTSGQVVMGASVGVRGRHACAQQPHHGLGYRTVVTPPHMVGAYYDRVGFRRDGSAFVLDLPAA